MTSDIPTYLKYYLSKTRLSGLVFNKTYIENLSGTSFYLEHSVASTLKINFKASDTTQDGTPTPDYPQEIHTVRGDNEINIENKNLFDKDNISLGYVKEDGTLSSDSAYRTSDFVPIQPNTAYYKTNTASPRTKYYDSNKQPLNTTTYQDISIGGNAGTFTTPANAKYLRFSFPFTGVNAVDVNSIMLNKGTQATPYTEHQEQNYPISLVISKNIFDISKIIRGVELNSNTGAEQPNANWWLSDYMMIKPNTEYTSSNIYSLTKCWYDKDKNFISRVQQETGTSPSNARYLRVNGTIASIESNPDAQIEEGSVVTTFEEYKTLEMCKINNYADEFFKNIPESEYYDSTLENGKWYKYGRIGKVVLDGTQNITLNTSSPRRFNANYSTLGLDNIVDSLTLRYCDHFIYNPREDTWGYYYLYKNWLVLFDTQSVIENASALSEWFRNNNTNIYYPLETPTKTLLSDTLQTQLDNIYNNAHTYDKITNISQVNDDRPFILDISYFRKVK